MHANASGLSDQDIIDIAKYFESINDQDKFHISIAFICYSAFFADSSFDRGKEKSVTCAACHGRW